MKFYRIGCAAQRGFFWLNLPSEVDSWLKLGTGLRDPDRMIAYRVQGGARPGDMLDTLVWSTRLIHVLERFGARGYASYSIQVLHGRRQLPGYRGIRVYGKGGPFDRVRSGAEYVDGGPISYERVCMDETQWDRSDIFTIPGLGISIFVVDSLATRLMELKPQNVDIEAADACSLP